MIVKVLPRSLQVLIRFWDLSSRISEHGLIEGQLFSQQKDHEGHAVHASSEAQYMSYCHESPHPQERFRLSLLQE